VPEMSSSSSKPLLKALHGEALLVPPVWLMRQAGRYLPEYRALRAKARDFLSFCLTPELAAEATLQPIRRFGLDGAIVFSDILVVPYALGQRIEFREGEGPVLEAIGDPAAFGALDSSRVSERTAPVMETIRSVRTGLPSGVALIGFAGAPWTVATYMVEGGSSRDFQRVKRWAYGDPGSFQKLIDRLVDATTGYLMDQIEAGAEVIQVFDSWAGVLPGPEFERWVIQPMKRITAALRTKHPAVPIIGFPRGAGTHCKAYAQGSGVDCVSLDQTIDVDWARTHLQTRLPVQGNLDPIHLLVGGEPMARAIRGILGALGKGGFVFNLGHGILPQTPPQHVAALVDIVRA